MKTLFISLALILFVGTVGLGFWNAAGDTATEVRFSDIEAGFEDMNGSPEAIYEEPTSPAEQHITPPPGSSLFFGWGSYWREFSEEERKFYENWRRPPGPPRVGIQAGHWKNDEVPDELAGLERNGGGAQGGGRSEVDVVLEIARLTKILLEVEGVVVDLIPATVPPDYAADAFVSIHADGNNNSAVSGFKIAAPRRDFSGRASSLVSALYESYEQETGLRRDASVSRRMSSYYAFNWRRYDHAVHPMTPAAIVETGFMTSPRDREIIVSAPERAAEGIAEGILKFLSL